MLCFAPQQYTFQLNPEKATFLENFELVITRLLKFEAQIAPPYIPEQLTKLEKAIMREDGP